MLTLISKKVPSFKVVPAQGGYCVVKVIDGTVEVVSGPVSDRGQAILIRDNFENSKTIEVVYRKD